MPWTEKQEQVIKERDKTILVSAAAGSGKTATLVERIYQKMIDPEHPVDITSFLVVTFTKAAAAQMKEKLLKKLEEAQEASSVVATEEKEAMDGVLKKMQGFDFTKFN